MPIGVITNASAVFIGGIIGAFLGKYIPKRTEETLTVVFGYCSFALGITSVMNYSATAPIILAVITGTVIGSLIKLEERIQNGFRIFLNKLPIPSEHLDMDRYITVVVIFCTGGLGIFGSLTEGISGDPSLLMSKSVLDLFSAVVFAGTLGIAVSVIALPQFLVFGTLFLTAQYIAPFITGDALNNFIATGGVMTLASSLKVAKIKNIPVGDMIPALILSPFMTKLWELLPF